MSEKLPFELQNDEEIVEEHKPKLFGFIIISSLGAYIGVIAIILFLFFFFVLMSRFSTSLSVVGISLVVFLSLPLLLIVSIKPIITYGKLKYWITTHRVI